ncbi:MAG: hypothetical protein NW203_07210 [Hyphomonadaceae bacterium]|nr:hypothetical protein [Hyphomonadaceae bacterium]
MTWLRTPRATLRLAGPDARGFLDSLVTQDLTRRAPQAVVYAGLLSPQGKVSADFLIWTQGDDLVLDVDPAFAEPLRRRLALYRLRAAVEIAPAGLAVERWHGKAPPPDAAAAAPDPRRAGLGWRRLVSSDNAAPNDAFWLEDRVQVGAPDLAADAAPEEVFALEALFEELNGVAFDKGCFVGQENVSRMKRRATTRRKFCPLALQAPAAPGAAVSAGPAEIGTVRAVSGLRALALLRLDRAFEALDAGEALNVAGAPAALDPPAWLRLPPRGDAP